MKIVDDWKLIIKRFWSFRLAVLSSVFSAAEMVIQLGVWQPDIPPAMFAGIALFTSAAAGIARIVAQPKAYDHD